MVKQLLSKYFGFRTSYPKLDLDSLPETDDTSVSSNDDSIQDAVKIDEDVKVWMDLMKRMPKEQQLFLLQNHLRTKLGIVPPSTTKRTKVARSQSLKKIKQFRWAELTGGNIRTTTKPISLIDESNWWSPSEQSDIRLHAIRMVKYCRTRRPDIGVSLVVLSEDLDCKNEHMDKLTNDSFARGLESHLVPTLAALRKTVVQDVLEEQEACKGLSYEERAERLREISMEISEPSRVLAGKLGECDQMDALTSSLSQWTTRSRPARVDDNSGFFD